MLSSGVDQYPSTYKVYIGCYPQFLRKTLLLTERQVCILYGIAINSRFVLVKRVGLPQFVNSSRAIFQELFLLRVIELPRANLYSSILRQLNNETVKYKVNWLKQVSHNYKTVEGLLKEIRKKKPGFILKC